MNKKIFIYCIVITISSYNCSSSKVNSNKISEKINEKKDSTFVDVNKIQDTFSIYCYGKRVLIDKRKYTTDYFEYMDITNCLSDMAFKGDSNAITAIINHANSKNFNKFKQFSYPFRGKRLFEHILYNIASEIYCGNPWADPYPDYVDEAISPGFMTLIDMIDTINGETYGFRDVLDFTVEERNALDSKYEHLYRKKDGTYLEICPGSLQVCNDYWQIRVAYERGLVVLKDFGER